VRSVVVLLVALMLLLPLVGCGGGRHGLKTATAETGVRGYLCGLNNCARLPVALAAAVSESVRGLQRLTQPAPAPTYVITIAPSAAASANLFIGWLPTEGIFLVAGRSSRPHWFRVPDRLTPQLRRAARSMRPNPAPRRWAVTKPLPRPPRNALGKAEGTMCLVENCAEIDRMIGNWLRRGGIPRGHAVGAFYFYRSGCLNCHTYRNSGATELGAPDLTHVGRKLSKRRVVAALTCPTCAQPGSAMPSFAGLPKATIGSLTAFLAASR
jgi:hypothetical protein